LKLGKLGGLEEDCVLNFQLSQVLAGIILIRPFFGVLAHFLIAQISLQAAMKTTKNLQKKNEILREALCGA